MTVLTDNTKIAAFCATLAEKDFITIDTEFLREKTYYPKLCLIQLSCPEKYAVAIDPLADGVDLEPVFDLLANPSVLKVFHAARQDLEIFFNLTGEVVAPVFDTQIAAMVCGFGDSIGYDRLVKAITKESIDKSSQFTNWTLRPLSEKQVEYALGDVTHLCDVYTHLKADLKRRNRSSWVDQELAALCDHALYDIDPYKSWERVKIRSPKSKTLVVLKELAAWREEEAQRKDIPKTWLMKDDTMCDLAHQAPQNKKQLAKIRNLSKDLSEGKRSDIILKRIDTALSTPKDEWPQPVKKTPLPQAAQTVSEVLKMLLKVHSAQHDVASKIIASSSDIEAIALDDNADVMALKGWRREVFGADALAVKHGKLAIGLDQGEICIFPIAEVDALPDGVGQDA